MEVTSIFYWFVIGYCVFSMHCDIMFYYSGSVAYVVLICVMHAMKHSKNDEG